MSLLALAHWRTNKELRYRRTSVYYLCRKLETAVSPMTIRFDEVTRFVSEIFTRTETLRVSRWGGSGGRVGGRCRRFSLDFGGSPPWRSVSLGCHRASRWFRRFPARFYALYMRKIWNKYCSLIDIFFSFYYSDRRAWDRECNACKSNSIFKWFEFAIAFKFQSFINCIDTIAIVSIYHEFISHCVTHAISQLSHL